MNKRFSFLVVSLFVASALNASLVHAASDALIAAEMGTITFSDVKSGTRYFTGVPYVANRGMMKGIENTSFGLNQNATRIEAIYGIMKGLDLIKEDVGETGITSNFKDIRKSNYAFNAVNQAYSDGLLEGITMRKSYLKPSAPITTGEVLRIFNNALHRDANAASIELKYEVKSGFPDGWAFSNDVRLALSEGAIMQKSDGNLVIDPTQKLTRGDLAVLLYRLTETRNEGTGFGLASWYGDGLSKVKVEGERANELRSQFLTAANRTLPIGTILRVTNEMNGKSVEVVVNDRGPYIAGRIVDLSKSAFSAIENVGAGTAAVKIEVIQKIE